MKRLVFPLLVPIILALAVVPARSQDWQKAVDLFKRGRYLEAAMEAKGVIEATNPDWAEGRIFLGLCYLKAKKYQEALVELDKAIQSDPEIAQAYLYLGQVYAAQNKHSEALKQFQKAIQKADKPKEKKYLPLIFAEAGDSAFAAERWDEAARYYRQAVQAAPSQHAIWFKLGLTLFKQNDFEAALEPLNRAYNAQPRNKTYGLYYLRALNYAKKWSQAVNIADQLLKIYPNESDVLQAAGNAYLGAKKFARAIQAYKDYLQTHPDDGWMHFNYAQALVGAERYQEAEASLKKAAQILNNYRVYALLGYVYIKMKRYQDAKSQYKKAYDLSKKPEYFEEIKKIEKRIEQEELKKKGLAEEVKPPQVR